MGWGPGTCLLLLVFSMLIQCIASCRELRCGSSGVSNEVEKQRKVAVEPEARWRDAASGVT